jgi:hypothetical protein
MMQPTGLAESPMNSATSSAVAAVTTNTFLPPVDAVTSRVSTCQTVGTRFYLDGEPRHQPYRAGSGPSSSAGAPGQCTVLLDDGIGSEARGEDTIRAAG